MSVFQLQNNDLTIKVKSFGAELCSVFSSTNNIEYIWQANQDLWPRHAPNLFPIVGKLKDNSFSYLNNNFQLPQHGFARDSEFICVEETESKLTFELTANEETLKHYPFHFSLQISYTLTDNNLITSYKIFNPSNSEIYFSVGAHPAFNCPLQTSETFEDYNLVFPTKKELVINTLNDGLIKNNTKTISLIENKLKVSKTLFDNDALVFMNSQIENVSLISNKTKHGVSMECDNWPFFGIWTKKNSEKFICLEPWFGIADSETTNSNFTNKKGVIKLLPEQNFDCSFNILFF
jgi:galactose mutarotase-like enzyme